MNIFGIILSGTDLWLLAVAGGGLAWLLPQWLAVSRERQSAFRSASANLRETFAPALARLENARLHGSTHDVPDVDGLLQSQFETYSAAVEEFSHFVPAVRIRRYKKAWQQYCAIANAGTASPVFMATTINERNPYSALEQLIRAILSFSKT